jgi:SAM-dependent methyltransferase
LSNVSKLPDATGSWDEQYRHYQRTLTARYLIPALESWGIVLEGRSLLEAGSGNGGCAAEFHRAGCRVTAVEIDSRLVDIAAEFNAREGLPINTHLGDVCRPDCPGFDEGPFDVVLLRDVVEHLEDLEGALANLGNVLSPDGVLFVVFPPYYSPFGAHQQILPRRGIGPLALNKLPWIQLLPDALFRRIAAGSTPANAEVTRLRTIRLTLRRFERTAAAAGFDIAKRRLYHVRPTHKLRYGLPVLGAPVLGRIPLLNELVVSAGYYLLRRTA